MKGNEGSANCAANKANKRNEGHANCAAIIPNLKKNRKNQFRELRILGEPSSEQIDSILRLLISADIKINLKNNLNQDELSGTIPTTKQSY